MLFPSLLFHVGCSVVGAPSCVDSFILSRSYAIARVDLNYYHVFVCMCACTTFTFTHKHNYSLTTSTLMSVVHGGCKEVSVEAGRHTHTHTQLSSGFRFASSINISINIIEC